MDELYFPFDAVESNGEYDRVYSAKDFSDYFKQFVGNGIFPNPSTNLQVKTLYNNMVLTVTKGSAFINGYCYILKEDMNVSINTSDAAYNRKDAIVLQLNLTQRKMTILYKAGTASASPVVSALVRNDDVYELRLAEILVKSGAVKIANTEITDTRTNGNVCGVVTNVVQSVDSTTLYNQYQTYLTNKIAEWNATKTQQTTDFNSQMNSQAVTFNTKQTEIQNWFNTIQTDQGHNHDARYYQKTEVDTRITKGSVAYSTNAGKLDGVTLAEIREEIKKAGDIVGKKMLFERATVPYTSGSGAVLIKNYVNAKGGMVRIVPEKFTSASEYKLIIDNVMVFDFTSGEVLFGSGRVTPLDFSFSNSFQLYANELYSISSSASISTSIIYYINQ